MSRYEHFRMDLTPRVLALIADCVEPHVATCDPAVQVELHNFLNECRARVQHVAAGLPDLSEPESVPGCSTEEGWLDE